MEMHKQINHRVPNCVPRPLTHCSKYSFLPHTLRQKSSGEPEWECPFLKAMSIRSCTLVSAERKVINVKRVNVAKGLMLLKG